MVCLPPYVLMKLHRWAKVSVSSVVQAFMKAGTITEQLSYSNKTDSDKTRRILACLMWKSCKC